MKKLLLALVIVSLFSISVFADSFTVYLYSGGETITVTSNSTVTLENGTEVNIEAHEDGKVGIIVTISWEDLLDSFSMKVVTNESGGPTYESTTIPALEPDMAEHCVRAKWLFSD